jgi:hypothetical protein
MINVNQLSDIYPFHGTSVSQLDKSERLGLDDMLLVSIDGESKSVGYGQLLDHLYRDVIRHKLSVGTMAFEGKGSFSLTSHNHDGRYNKLEIPNRGSGAYTLLSVTSISSDGNSIMTRVRSPRYISPAPPEPAPGTVKFVYSNKRTYGQNSPYSNLSSLIAAKQFDGWVYADTSYPGIVFKSVDPNRQLSSDVVSSL